MQCFVVKVFSENMYCRPILINKLALLMQSISFRKAC